MAKQKASPKSEAVKEETPKKKPAPKKTEGVWRCNLYIRGYGRVNEGEDVTAEAVALLKDASKYVE